MTSSLESILARLGSQPYRHATASWILSSARHLTGGSSPVQRCHLHHARMEVRAFGSYRMILKTISSISDWMWIFSFQRCADRQRYALVTGDNEVRSEYLQG